ncbi:hypothetical protein [Streptosporangium sp. NPDC004631]
MFDILPTVEESPTPALLTPALPRAALLAPALLSAVTGRGRTGAR